MILTMITNWYKKQSIRRKLILITVSVSTTTLILIASLYLASSYFQTREILNQKIEVVGQIMAKEVLAAVLYDDADAASDTLSSANEIQSVTRACLYDKHGKIFSQYVRKHHGKEVRCIHDGFVSGAQNHHFLAPTGNGVSFTISILHQQVAIGYLTIFASNAEVIQQTLFQVALLSLGILVSILISIMLASQLQKTISTPIRALSQTARDYTNETSSPIRAKKYSDDEVGKLVVSFNTMLETIERQKQTLLETNRDLEGANTELEEFAYRTSHDLRSPIVSSLELLNVAGTYLEQGQFDNVKQCIDFSQSQLTKLETLIQDILQLTQAKNIDEADEVVNVREVVIESLNKLSYMPNFDTIDIQTNLNAPDYVAVQKLRLSMIVENLLSNAIKYYDVDKELPIIIISSRLNGTCYEVTIEDNGLGIPEGKRGKIFTMFTRFHPKISFGSGLGLYLIKKSANMMGAEISYQGRESGGSIFKLEIPTAEGLRLPQENSKVA